MVKEHMRTDNLQPMGSGGKDLKFESGRMASCNIIVCTPGRLLQHMDENPDFDAANLKM